MAVELRTQIERDLGIVVPVVQLLSGPNVTGLAHWLGDRLASTDPAEPDPTAAADTGATLAQLPEAPEDGRLHQVTRERVYCHIPEPSTN